MKKFWNWIKNSDDTRILRLEGPIDEESFWGDEITPQMFRDELESGEGDVTVWINSPGGNVFAAAEIYTMLRDYKGSITVKIDAIAASAASVVAMAGDTVQMSPVAMLMIHDPSTVAMGNTKDMEKAIEVLNEVKDNFTDAYSFNIESVPAERAAVILCQKDNVLYDHNDKFIYSNQWIPLSAKCTIQEKLRLSSILDEKCSGGSIAHINLESNFPNTETAWKMLNKIAQAGVIYFAFNTRINECKNHHGFVGTDHCPVCGEPVFDTYQRIVGYLVPSRAYSKDRFREFNTRQWYSYAEAMSE